MGVYSIIFSLFVTTLTQTSMETCAEEKKDIRALTSQQHVTQGRSLMRDYRKTVQKLPKPPQQFPFWGNQITTLRVPSRRRGTACGIPLGGGECLT